MRFPRSKYKSKKNGWLCATGTLLKITVESTEHYHIVRRYFNVLHFTVKYREVNGNYGL